MNLFRYGDFKLHSGADLQFKIDCDALTPADWECLAVMIAMRVGDFSSIYGIPQGGVKLAAELVRYAEPRKIGPTLVVDDVWTTGESMRRCLRKDDVGYVVFARGPLDANVRALFTLDAPQCDDALRAAIEWIDTPNHFRTSATALLAKLRKALK